MQISKFYHLGDLMKKTWELEEYKAPNTNKELRLTPKQWLNNEYSKERGR